MASAKPTSKSKPVQVTDMLLQQFVGYHLRRASAVIQDDMQRALEPLGLKMMTFVGLAIVIENPGVSQTRLAQSINIERSGVVPLIDQLEKRGLVERQRVPGDRRSYALRATAQGEALWREAELCVRAHENDLFSQADERAMSEIKTHCTSVWQNS